MNEYQRKPFQLPNEGPFEDRYHIQSDEIQHLKQNNVQGIFLQTVDLSTAASPGSPLVIPVPGRGFQCYFLQTSDAYDPSINNTAFDNYNPTASPNLVWARINYNAPSAGLPIKHGRGYVGTFHQVQFQWPAQDGISMRVVIFTWDGMPWQSGTYDV